MENRFLCVRYIDGEWVGLPETVEEKLRSAREDRRKETKKGKRNLQGYEAEAIVLQALWKMNYRLADKVLGIGYANALRREYIFEEITSTQSS